MPNPIIPCSILWVMFRIEQYESHEAWAYPYDHRCIVEGRVEDLPVLHGLIIERP
jgi:hypothetical protein